MIHPEDCSCQLCEKGRVAFEEHCEQRAERARRAAARAPRDRAHKPAEYRRGKRVVSKGCKGCHGKNSRVSKSVSFIANYEP